MGVVGLWGGDVGLGDLWGRAVGSMGQRCGCMGWRCGFMGRSLGAEGSMGSNCRVYGAEIWGRVICGAETWIYGAEMWVYGVELWG